MNNNIARSITKQHTIRVGKRGTSPVCQYSIITGNMKRTAITPRTTLMDVKNIYGL